MPQKINNINILFLPLFFLPISIIIGQAAISITLLFFELHQHNVP